MSTDLIVVIVIFAGTLYWGDLLNPQSSVDKSELPILPAA